MVLKIRYDLETLSQNQHHMDQIINNMNLKIQKNEARNETITTVIANQKDNCGSSLPITNEEEVIEFDTKLLDKNFMTYVV